MTTQTHRSCRTCHILAWSPLREIAFGSRTATSITWDAKCFAREPLRPERSHRNQHALRSHPQLHTGRDYAIFPTRGLPPGRTRLGTDWVQQEVHPVAIFGVHASEWRLHRSPRRHLPPPRHINLPSIMAPRTLELQIQQLEDGQIIFGKFPVNVFYIRRSLMVSLTAPIDRTASTTPTGSIATTRPEVLPATDVEQTHPRTPIT
jgi:hypothetical protein